MDGDALTDRLLAAVSVAAHAKFDIAPIATSAEAITELDSSTAAKFSRHLVVRLPGVAFASTRDVGAFVAALLAESGDAFVVCKVCHLPSCAHTDLRVNCKQSSHQVSGRSHMLKASATQDECASSYVNRHGHKTQ